jgi:hypothetical protein
MTSESSPNVTSSPVSEGGHLRSVSPGGPMTAPSGPDRARVNLSHRQALVLGLTTNGIYGPRSGGSSSSADLQRSLASRLRQSLDGAGCPIFSLTWKTWDIGRLEPICALRASAPRTSGNGSGGWPTPVMNDETGSTHCYTGTDGIALKLPGAAWSTIATRDWKDSGDLTKSMVRRDGKTRLDRLGFQAFISTAKMGNPGSLNPALSRWLMGYPPAWDACAVTVMPSSRKSRRRS